MHCATTSPQDTHNIIIPFEPPRVLTCSQQRQLLFLGDAQLQTAQCVVIRVAASRGGAEMSAVISGGAMPAASQVVPRGPWRPQRTLKTRG